jgi:NhaP-type Na+/H+ or K+/H+ antiporter
MTENRTKPHLQVQTFLPLGLTLLPLLIAVVIRLAGGIRSSLISDILTGAGVAALGGILTGLIVDRFIRRKQGDVELLVGLALATAVGVLTIGYLYLIHIRGPIASIGDTDRAVEQVTVFLTYLFAQTLGIQLAESVLPDVETEARSTSRG